MIDFSNYRMVIIVYILITKTNCDFDFSSRYVNMQSAIQIEIPISLVKSTLRNKNKFNSFKSEGTGRLLLCQKHIPNLYPYLYISCTWLWWNNNECATKPYFMDKIPENDSLCSGIPLQLLLKSWQMPFESI